MEYILILESISRHFIDGALPFSQWPLGLEGGGTCLNGPYARYAPAYQLSLYDRQFNR